MQKFLASTLGVIALTVAFTTHAEPSATANIPEKVSSNILKRHPQAQGLQASYETHFGQKLLEVRFKDESGQEVMELFNDKDHLFTNEVTVENHNDIFPPVIATLKKEFPGYSIQKAELIANPNGTGEEYEIYLTADGKNWKVFLNGHGAIQSKQQLTD
ncbi:hypothetical protein [Methylomonas rapida]|uniref:Beta-lactamase-inhibitor-like PepSY-like domain-containing protein n=1 Tax=Methylomonas rapida TaxID=2963939 RepID=A0ABY7GN17_9GAMM|nr:hypothetical protein [Methylomonas rapida]WAR45912.1 hypothetical protein NM686_005185 [Methylomonas rapida]